MRPIQAPIRQVRIPGTKLVKASELVKLHTFVIPTLYHEKVWLKAKRTFSGHVIISFAGPEGGHVVRLRGSQRVRIEKT